LQECELNTAVKAPYESFLTFIKHYLDFMFLNYTVEYYVELMPYATM